MNLFSVIATAVAGWFLFGRTRLNFHRGNTPKNRLPMTDHSNEPEYLQIFIKRANFKSIGSLVLITFFFVRQNRFGALIQTFSQKTAKNQISGRFPPLPSTRDVLDILLFTSA